MKHKEKCLKCGYEWETERIHPRECPACKRYDYDKPKKENKND